MKYLYFLTDVCRSCKGFVHATFLLILIGLIGFSPTQAQTTNLQPGEIAFTALNKDGDDDFCFVILRDLDPGTQINFTDCGWNDGLGFFVTGGDDVLTWTAPATPVLCGTQVCIKNAGPNNNTANIGSISAPGSGLTISSIGDQVFAYQGPFANPSLIAGIHSEIDIGVTDDGNWDGGTTTNSKSALPNVLINGVTAIRVYVQIGPFQLEFDNFRYDCNPNNGDAATILAAINNLSNWLPDDATPFTSAQLLSCSFNFTNCFTGPGLVCPSPGDLIITEIMQNPDAVFDVNGEWFEVYNTTAADIDMNGMIIRDDGGDTHTISSSVVVPAGGYAVLGLNGNTGTNGGVTVDYVYSGFTLGNSGDEVVIECSGTEIDRVNYDGGPNFPDPDGASMSLDPTKLNATDNDLGANWCESTSSFGDGDLGTPGYTNDICCDVSGTDTDSDGVCDHLDLDDDNDGILDINECNFTPLVQIGFEGAASVPDASSAADPGNNWFSNFNFAGSDVDYTVRSPDYVGDIAGTQWYVGAEALSFAALNTTDNTPRSTGNDGLGFNITATELSGAGAVPGDQVTVTFLYAGGRHYSAGGREANANTQIGIWFGNSTITSFSGLPAIPSETIFSGPFLTAGTIGGHPVMDPNAWKVYINAFTWTGGDVYLAVQALSGGGAVPAHVFVDDVKLIFPQTCPDHDLDLISNKDDTDSDNDGCVDAIEAGHTDPDDDGRLGMGPITVDALGLVVGQGGYTGTSPAVLDNTNNACIPVAICQDITIAADANCQASIVPGDIDNGSFDLQGDPLTLSLDNSGPFALGTHTVTLTVSDGTFSDQCTATVTVNDSTAPTVLCQDVTVYLDGTGNASITAAQIDNGSSDNCGPPSLSVSPSTFDCSDINVVNGCGSFALDFDGVNEYGLSANPISHGNNFTYEAWLFVSGFNNIFDFQGIVTTRTPSGNNHLVQMSVSTNGNLLGEIKGGAGDNSRKIYEGNTPLSNGWHHVAITFDGTNFLLYVDAVLQTPSIIDDDPVGTLAVNRNILLGAERLLNPTGFTDLTLDEVRIWNVTRSAVEIQNSYLSCFAGSEPGLIMYYQIEAGTGSTVTDLVAGNNATLINMENSDWVAAAPVLQTSPGVEVTLIATDAAGNVDSCTANVTVLDTIPPTITCPANITQGNDAGLCSAVVTFADPTFSDNCTGATLTCSPASGTVFPIGTTMVTCIATDSSGNVDSCSFAVTVNDTEAPVANCIGGGGGPPTPSVAYLTLQANPPWCEPACPGNSDNQDMLNDVFGSGNWDYYDFSVSPATVISSNYNFLFLDGSDATANAMETFLDANMPALEAWVAQGNVLFLNAAPNQGNGMSFGFGGVQLIYPAFASSVFASVPAHPIFNGPFTPVGTSFTGTFFGHAIICPPGLGATVLIEEVGSNDDILVEAPWGSGRVMFGGMTLPFWHSPKPHTLNLRRNIFEYLVTQIQPIDACFSPDANGQVNLTPADINDGSTDNCGIASMTVTPNSFTCSDIGVHIVELIVIDSAGNSDTCSATIEIADKTAPVISCPGNMTFNNDPGQCSAVVNFSASATDNCPAGMTVVCVPASGSVFPIGTTTVTCTATDAAGNVDSCSFTVTVNDAEAPVANCNDITVDLGVANPYTLTQADINAIAAGSSDNCPNFNWDVSGQTTYDCDDRDQDFTVILTVTDASGNTDTCHATVSVTDVTSVCNQPPVAICQDITVYTDANCQASITPADVDNGSFDPDGDPLTYSLDNSGPFAKGVFTVILTVDDGEFTDTCSATVTVEDTLAPVPPAPPADASYACAADVPLPPALTAMDNCTGPITVSPSESLTSGSCLNDFVLVRTWTFVDTCGNSSSISQTITVSDTLAPVPPAPPADVNVACAADVPPPVDLTAVDNCDGPITVSPSAVITPGSCLNDFVMVRIWTFVDTCGNTSSVSQTITVSDTIPPVFDCPDPIEVDADSNCQAIVTYSATAIDNCDGTVAVIFDPPSGSVFELGLTTVTATATDTCGNSSTCSFIVSVEDNTPPVITCPADVVRECDENTSPTSTGTATATDNCAVASIVFNDSTVLGLCSGSYTILRTWTATDSSFNTSSCVQTITVQDTVAPEITCPADVTIQCDEDQTPTSLGFATATDNCDNNPVILFTDATTPGICPGEYVITRTWSATDDCNNSVTCVQTITVIDTEAPVAPNPPADVTVECMDEVPAAAFLMAQDNCDGMIVGVVSDSITPGACVNEFTILRTWLFKDGCNNAVTISQTIVVDDNTAPVAPDLPDLSFQCADDVPLPAGVVTALDNCDGTVVGVLNADTIPGSCVNNFVITRTYTFTDGCGNQSSETQTITVNDDTDPVATCPADVTGLQCGDVPVAAATTIAEFYAMGGTVSDNCSDTSAISISHVDVDNGNTECVSDGIRVITRTYTFTDECGNSTSCSQTFSYDEDTAGPDITCPADESDLDCNYVVPAGATDIASFLALGGTASDNCTATGDLSVSYVDVDNMTLSCPGDARVIVRTYTITDACGNSSTCDQTFTYEEITTPPVIDCPVDLVCLCGNPDNPLLISNWLASVSGYSACPLGVTITNNYPNGTFTPSCGNAGTQEVTFTIVDDCGNVDSCTANIIFVDNNPPELNCPAPMTIGTDAGVCEADIAAGVLAISALDKCDPNFSVVNNSPYALDNNSADAAGVYPVGSYQITFTATDACGNVSSCTIDLTVVDDEDPQITCPANIEVDADPGLCGATVNFSMPTFSDNCPGVMMTQVSGMSSGDFFPTGTTVQEFMAIDAAGNTMTCSFTVTVVNTLSSICTVTGFDPGTPANFALFLNGLPGVSNPNFEWENGSGTLAVFLDGTATLTGKVINKGDPNVAFDVNIFLENEMDWATWSALGRNYKSNAFNQATADANHPNWTFWELSSSSSLTGSAGSTYDGDIINLTHKPADYSYGFQLGLGANDKDNDYGISGWYYYSGTLGGQSVNGDGDVNGDASCQANPCGAGISVAPRTILEGNYNIGTQLMHDDLRQAGLLPLLEPYSGLGFVHVGGGGESTTTAVLSVTGDDAIVDWVVVELRPQGNSSQVAATRSALIQRDGDIVDVDGLSPVSFVDQPEGNYHVAIYHRSHVPIMSEGAFSLLSSAAYLDFADGSVVSYGTNATKTMSGSVEGMYCGDADFDHTISSTDRALLWNNKNQTGYLNVDVDLDGACTASDRSFGWNNRNETMKF